LRGKVEMAYRHFTEMPVWQQGHETVSLVYRLISTFPGSERYALTSQMRRAAVSVTSNIAEAFGRKTSGDKARFYLMARGSRFEVQSQSHVARDVGYLAPESFDKLNQHLGQIIHDLNKIIKTLNSRSEPEPWP
jgi:four helix bundle protein